MPFVVALDQGTTSSRAIVFDEHAHAIATSQREFTQHFPKPGLVEHDPSEVWSTQRDVLAEAIDEAGIANSDIAALGMTNQRETAVLWDRTTGEPVHNAIVWQDRRTAGICERLIADGHADEINRGTGLVPDAYFSATKVQWMLENIPGLRDRAQRNELAFGTIDTWLLWQLTRGALHATDVSNASRTMLWNIHEHDWDERMLDLLRVPRELLPAVVPSSGHIANVADDLPAAGAPVAGIAGDQQAALAGQLCTTPSLAKNTYGTGCFLLAHTGNTPQRSENGLLTTVAWQREDQPVEYAIEGGVFVGGAAVQWLRDGLGIIDTAPECDRLAATVNDTAGCILVPAFAGLGAPHWDQRARGTIVGLTRGVTKAHLCRATLEGIAHSVADLLHAMERDADQPFPELRVDGGAAASDPLLQIQADLLQRPVVRPANLETTALGAAYLAGLATGVYTSFDALKDTWGEDRRFEPQISANEAKQRTERWRSAVERARAWIREDADA